MPIPTESSPLGLFFSDYVVHLWRRRLLVLGLTALTVVSVYLFMRYVIGEKFACTAELLVRKRFLVTFDEDSPRFEHPPAYKPMLTSDSTLDGVRAAYNRKHPGSQLRAPLEKFREWFEVDSSTIFETTIRREFSPIITLKAYGTSREQAKELMDIWIGECLSRFGNLNAEEARFARDTATKRHGELAGQLADSAAKVAVADASQRMAAGEIASTLRRLTSAPVPDVQRLLQKDVTLEGERPGSGAVQLNLAQPDSGNFGPGLWERLTQIDLELARARAGKDEASVAKLSAERDEAKKLAKGLGDRMGELTKRLESSRKAYAGALAEQLRLEAALRISSSNSGQAEAALQSSANAAEGADMRVISPAVTPEKRVGIGRSIVAIASGMAMLMFLVMISCAELYLKTALAKKQAA